MAWPTDVSPGQVVEANHINSGYLAVRAWGGDIDAGGHVAENLGRVNITSGAPELQLYETDQGSNAKGWKMVAVAGQLQIGAYNDANSAFNVALGITRSGASPLLIATSVPLQIGPETNPKLEVRGWAAPSLNIYETDAGSDAKGWRMRSAGAVFQMGCYDDADSGTFNPAFHVSRSGATPTAVSFDVGVGIGREGGGGSAKLEIDVSADRSFWLGKDGADNVLIQILNHFYGSHQSFTLQAADHLFKCGTTDALHITSTAKLRMVVPGHYANDAAAAAGGVPVNEIYRNGSALMIRVS